LFADTVDFVAYTVNFVADAVDFVATLYRALLFIIFAFKHQPCRDDSSVGLGLHTRECVDKV